MSTDNRYAELNDKLMRLLAEVEAAAVELGEHDLAAYQQLEAERGPAPDSPDAILTGLHSPDAAVRLLALAGLCCSDTSVRPGRPKRPSLADLKASTPGREWDRNSPGAQRVRELALTDPDPRVQTIAILLLTNFFYISPLVDIELVRGLARVARSTGDYHVRYGAFDALNLLTDSPLRGFAPLLAGVGFSPLRYDAGTVRFYAELDTTAPTAPPARPRVWDRLLPWRRPRRAG